MKRKKRSKLFFVFLCLGYCSVWAQTDEEFQHYLSLREEHFRTGDNRGYWSVSLAGGISLYQGEMDLDLKKTDLLTPYGKLMMARWFSSVWGLRLDIGGGKQKNGGIKKNEPDTHGYFYFMDSYLVLITNLMNWGTYKRSNRPLGIYIYAGGGGAWTPARDRIPVQLSPAAVAGGQLNIRLTDFWSISVGFEGTIVKDHFNSYTGGRKYEGYAGATAGLVYRFQ